MVGGAVEPPSETMLGIMVEEVKETPESILRDELDAARKQGDGVRSRVEVLRSFWKLLVRAGDSRNGCVSVEGATDTRRQVWVDAYRKVAFEELTNAPLNTRSFCDGVCRYLSTNPGSTSNDQGFLPSPTAADAINFVVQFCLPNEFVARDNRFIRELIICSTRAWYQSLKRDIAGAGSSTSWPNSTIALHGLLTKISRQFVTGREEITRRLVRLHLMSLLEFENKAADPDSPPHCIDGETGLDLIAVEQVLDSMVSWISSDRTTTDHRQGVLSDPTTPLCDPCAFREQWVIGWNNIAERVIAQPFHPQIQQEVLVSVANRSCFFDEASEEFFVEHADISNPLVDAFLRLEPADVPADDTAGDVAINANSSPFSLFCQALVQLFWRPNSGLTIPGAVYLLSRIQSVKVRDEVVARLLRKWCVKQLEPLRLQDKLICCVLIFGARTICAEHREQMCIRVGQPISSKLIHMQHHADQQYHMNNMLEAFFPGFKAAEGTLNTSGELIAAKKELRHAFDTNKSIEKDVGDGLAEVQRFREAYVQNSLSAYVTRFEFPCFLVSSSSEDDSSDKVCQRSEDSSEHVRSQSSDGNSESCQDEDDDGRPIEYIMFRGELRAMKKKIRANTSSSSNRGGNENASKLRADLQSRKETGEEYIDDGLEPLDDCEVRGRFLIILFFCFSVLR